MFHGYLKFLIFQFLKIHNLLFQISLFTNPLKNNHIQLRYPLFTLCHSLLHSHQRLYYQIQLLWYFIHHLFHLGWNLYLFLRRFNRWYLLRCIFWWTLSFLNILLLLNSSSSISQFITRFHLRNLLIFGPIQNINILNLIGLQISLPYHGQWITTTSGKIIPIFRKSTSISTTIMTIKSILKCTPINLPNLNFRIYRCSYQIIIFWMKIHLCHTLTMSIIILNQSPTPQIIQLHLFISRTRSQTCTIRIKFTIINPTQMITKLI